MRKIYPSYKLVLSRYLLSLLCIYLTQLAFYFLNSSLFQIESFSAFCKIFLGCTRYALSSLSVFLAPYLLLTLLPIVWKSNKVYRIVSDVFYYLANVFMMVVNLVDCGYYRFTFKRLTADITRYLGVGGDFKELIPQFIRDYWQIVVIFIVLIIGFIFADKFIRRKFKPENISFSKRWFAIQCSVFFVVVPLLIISQRGGLQTRPLNLMHASMYASTQNTALVLNTPFTLYRTFGKPSLEKKAFFSSDEVGKIYNPHIVPAKNIWADSLFVSPLEVGKTNVVIIILESFSAEYLKTYNKTGISYTPFLDSLASKSIVFQGMSNGKKSIDGIPAVLSSLPIMMEESYLTSCYGENKLGSIASDLAKHGYATAFFHGGYNGTMNFDNYTKKIGFEHYYGKNEYNNDADYDGNWGIYDEPFLQYVVKQIDTISKPFVSALFTLSSHHPYSIPEQHIGRFPKGSMIVHETVGYTDYALKRFFEQASKTKWYDNTLFIITSDHSALTSQKEFKTQLGLFKIPMIVFHPQLTQGVVSDRIMQQIDVYPTIADLIHLEDRIFCFGHSAFSSEYDFYIYYTNGEYLLLSDGYLSKYKEGYPIELYDTKTDEGLKLDIAGKNKERANKHQRLTEAIIQQYNNNIISNSTQP